MEGVTVNLLVSTTLNAVEAALGNDGDVARSCKLVPGLLSRRLENVATPLTAATLMVPASFAPVGAFRRVMLIGSLLVVTTLPKLSCTCTLTAGASGTLGRPPVGDWPKTNFVGAEGVTWTVVCPLVRPVADAV